MVVGMVLYMLAGMLDQWFVPPAHANDVWQVRLAALCMPIFVLALSFTPWFAARCHAFLAAVGLAAGAGVIALQAYLPMESAAYYYPTLVLVTFYTYNFVGTRFVHALVVDLILLVTYNAVFGGFLNYPAHILVSHDFFIVSANLIGGTAGYLAERQRRILFLQARKLHDLSLAKGRLFAAASHDLRQPIHAMVLFLDALKRSSNKAEQAKRIDSLSLALTALREMLDSLLDVSKLDAGVVSAKPARVIGDDLFREISETFGPLAKERGLRFKLWFPREAVVMHTDQRLLLNVLHNILSNAIKHTAKGGVLVALRHRGDGMVFQVWDTGEGIAAEHIARIFEEYYQVGNPERDRAKGMGLGLAIATRLCALLRFRLTCRSRPGRGSVFEVAIPASALRAPIVEPEVACVVPEEKQPVPAGTRIVLVEDDPLVASALGDALATRGIEVCIHKDAETALKDPVSMQADAFIVDHQLVGAMNGVDFLRLISEARGERVRAVVISGNTSGDFVQSARELRWPLLLKPTDPGDILQALAT